MKKITRHTKVQRNINMAKSKKRNKTPETDPKETQIYLLPDKKLKIIVIRSLMSLKRTQTTK